MLENLHDVALTAFQKLDVFSVPGIGTFRRVYNEAKINHQSKEILPPSETFTLEREELQVQNLEDFFFRYFKINVRKAKEMVVGMAAFLESKTANGGTFEIPGTGKLVADDSGTIHLRQPAGMAAQRSDFFGLGPVKFTLGDRVSTEEPRTKEEAITAALAHKTVKTEAPEPMRRRKTWPILLILLLLAVGVGGFIFRDNIKGFMADRGWIEGSNASAILADGTQQHGHGPDWNTTGSESHGKTPDENGTNGIAQANPTEPKKNTEPKKVVTPVKPIKKEVAPVKPPVKQEQKKPINTTSNKNIGKAPVAGTFYLVVASTMNAEEAEAIARQQSTKATVIAPPGGRGYYKVCVFESRNKPQVIQQMVEWKSRYSKSWIYYLGM